MKASRLLFLLFLFFGFEASCVPLLVSDIKVTGNERTKNEVILRELPFTVGSTIESTTLDDLKQVAWMNLNNTQLFHSVAVSYQVNQDSSDVYWAITLNERWHIFMNVNGSLAENNVNTFFRTRDFSRINLGADVVVNGLTGQRDNLTLVVQGGWTTKLGLKYDLPGINDSRTFGLGSELYYANNREINYASFNNKRTFYKADYFIQKEAIALINLHWRPALFDAFRLTTGYKGVFAADTISQLPFNYLAQDRNMNRYIFLELGYRREKRDNKSYPLSGYLVDVKATQHGLGIIEKDGITIGEAKMTVNQHAHLNNRWYFAHGAKFKYTFGQPPYYFQRGLGYESEFMRGYELFVIDGQHYALYKSNLKYNLIQKKTVTLNTKRFKKFNEIPYSLFLNAFGDMGYVVDNIHDISNPLANQINYSFGLGLDFVSYYDIVIRMEGSINAQGQPGFYIHFKNPI